jgi:thiamine-monophosphate kinase
MGQGAVVQKDVSPLKDMLGGMAGLGELALIDRIRRGSASRNGAVRLGIGDDCAVLRVPGGHEMVITTDFCLEGRHFRRDWHSPQSAGHRCLARGLSDVAAMGGRPLAAFLSLALPKGFDLAWLDGFMEGFHALALKYEVELAGGDTAEAPDERSLADVMVVGAVPEGMALKRSGARHGIYVTGTLGGAAVELEEMRAGCARRRRGVDACPQSFPEPRVAVGQGLSFAGSCIDLSDGLSTDLRHLCEASGCGAEIWEATLPIAPGATLDQALHGGEDYELLFTAPEPVPEEIAGVRVTRIGNIGGAGIRMLSKETEWVDLPRGGWEHFRA